MTRTQRDRGVPDSTGPSREQEEVTIQKLEDQRFDAILADDWGTFANLCHPDLRYVHNTGVVDTVESYLHKLRSGHYDYHRIDHPTERILVHGDTAVVWGRMRASLRAGVRHKEADNLTLSIWVREPGASWLLIAQQPTPAPTPAPVETTPSESASTGPRP